jgi:hypothetical protein
MPAGGDGQTVILKNLTESQGENPYLHLVGGTRHLIGNIQWPRAHVGVGEKPGQGRGGSGSWRKCRGET